MKKLDNTKNIDNGLLPFTDEELVDEGLRRYSLGLFTRKDFKLVVKLALNIGYDPTFLWDFEIAYGGNINE